MMRFFILLLVFLSASVITVAQPPHIHQLMEKMKSGKELTEADEKLFSEWVASMGKGASPKNEANKSKQESDGKSGTLNLCPKVQEKLPNLSPLTSEDFLALARSLMVSYGPKMGIEASGLKKMLATGKPTDGADLGVMFSMIGAGSATIYSTAWSALQKPADLLTANNLGIALKEMGETTKALQVLLYANKIRPNIPLISLNLGWVYRDLGDVANARIMFERALQLAPELPSALLGLGLVAECEGNHARALQLLRKSLAQRYSAIGVKAYQQAKSVQQTGSNKAQNQPITDEKEASPDFDLPPLPVAEKRGKMGNAASLFNDYSSKLESQILSLQTEYISLNELVNQQVTKSRQDPAHSVVITRDFSRELFMLHDIRELLWGENSQWTMKVKESKELLAMITKTALADAPALQQMGEKNIQLSRKYNELQLVLIEELKACGSDEACCKAAESRFNSKTRPILTEMEQIEFRTCKLTKSELDISFAKKCKAWKILSDELEASSRDYFAFSNPILSRIYMPALNERENVLRKLVVLSAQRSVLAIIQELPTDVQNYNDLTCIEPEPPEQPDIVKDPKLPKKEKAPCPLGEDGIKAGIGGISFELSCEHAKISGGEGWLWSLKRDFGKHQTIAWGGIGAKVEYGHGNITGEATVGIEVTIGQGAVKDVAVTSSVKAGLGGLVESEISGRYALEGGGSIESESQLVEPGLQDLLIKPDSDN